MQKQNWMATAMLLSLGTSACATVAETEASPSDVEGAATLALVKAPADASCLRVDIESSARKLTRLLPLTPGKAASFRLEGLPTGRVAFTGNAFNAPCEGVFTNSIPSWYSDLTYAQVQVVQTAHVLLEMIRNGRAAVTVDFDESNGSSDAPSVEDLPGVTSSQASYLVPVAEGVQVRALLTVGDSSNLKPDGTPYRMVGIPDGLGAYDNGDGTFTLLANQELGKENGIRRAHGAAGAFVSKWRVRKSDLAVLHGEDLIEQVTRWNPLLSTYDAPIRGEAMGRFCAADLPDQSAFYDAVSGFGTEDRLFLNGEEIGAEGRAFAHALDGVSYELPRLGKLSFENAVAAPSTGERTVVIGLDDGDGGQVYVYAGTKTASGSAIERAGLTNGTLFAISVPGHRNEHPTTGIPTVPFEVAELGNVENWTGAQLERASREVQATSFQRPEDGAWDPLNPNDFYFVSTASVAGRSRLWRLRFADAANPELGGTIEMLLDGTEGQLMMDNIGIDRRGHIMIVEDVGSHDHLGRVLRYDIATDTLTVVAQHDPARFVPGAPNFLTRDEEASGIIDAADLLGDGWFLLDVQAHFGLESELVQGGQFLALFDPGAL